jgi:hypothetical protein
MFSQASGIPSNYALFADCKGGLYEVIRSYSNAVANNKLDK